MSVAPQRRPVTLGLALTLTLTALAACRSETSGAASVRADTASPAQLEARIRARLDSLDAESSFYARNLPTGREIAIRADRPMNTLSVIKIPIMVLAYRDADAGRLNLEERHRITSDELRRGSGLLQTFDVGLEPTYRDIVTQMIITSDNTATDIMIHKLGLDRVNALLSDLGYSETRLLTTTGALFKQVWVIVDSANDSLTDHEVFEKGFPSDSGAPERSFAFVADSTQWLGRTTAREMSRLLEQIYNGELASKASTEAMLRTLGRQFYSSRLPRFIGSRVRVAHKTGDWPPYSGNDVGILFYEGGPTIVSVFTGENRGDFVKLEQTLGHIAEDLVDAWR